MIVEHKELVKEIYSLFSAKFSKKEQDVFNKWIDKYNNKTNSALDKKNVKNVYHLIKDILDDYDLGLCYVNKNNTKDNDKMIIQPKNEVVDYGGRLPTVRAGAGREFGAGCKGRARATCTVQRA